MIYCEQFIHGYFKGLGYRLLKSANLNQILSHKSLNYLTHLDGNSVIQSLLPENLIAITYLSHGKDEYGRRTVWNHTIILSVQDYFTLHPPKLFEPHFIQGMKKLVSNLEPLKVETHE